MRTRRRTAASPLLAAIVLACALLSACDDRDGRRGRDGAGAAGEEALPTPVTGGGVTGTADVGPGGVAPTLGAGAPVVSASDPSAIALGPDGLPIDGMPADGALPGAADEGIVIDATGGSASFVNPETGLAADPDGGGPLAAPQAQDIGAAEPTSADAVAVVRDYYAAINARSFGRAYALWSGGGRASGQTPEQFSGGYAQTQGVSVSIGAAGAQDAGAGQRYIQVPVSLRATQADGSVRRYAGSFTLHRAVSDGATPDQRAWRIRNADLREVTQ